MAGRYIPTDILFNILVLLPASSLQRLKYINKEWFHTISDPTFAEAHFAHQSEFGYNYKVLISLNKVDVFVGERLLSNPNPPRRLNLPGVHGQAYIRDSCKGLVLYQCGTSLHVANPITGDRLSLPLFYGYSGSILYANMGCDCDGELKVVVVGRQGWKIFMDPLICGVLTLGSRSWREVHIPIRAYLLEPNREPSLAGGALHWIYDTGILSLDLAQEKFHKTEVTFCNYNRLRYRSSLLEWDGCFAIFVRRSLINPSFSGWVLKESGWMKLLDIDVAFFKRLGFPSIEYGSSIEYGPFFTSTSRNGQIILFSQIVKGGMHLFAYDLGRGTMTKFTEFDSNFFLPYLKQDCWYFLAHTDSVVSCSSCDVVSCSSSNCDLPLPKRIGVRDLATNFFAYLRYTLGDLFRC